MWLQVVMVVTGGAKKGIFSKSPQAFSSKSVPESTHRNGSLDISQQNGTFFHLRFVPDQCCVVTGD